MNIAKAACVVGMRAVKKAQEAFPAVAGTTVKPDDTIVTAADRDSQRTILAMIAKLTSGEHSVWGEEGPTKAFIGSHPMGFIVDPLDGTGAFAVGLPTSTVIVGLYNRQAARLVGCVIGEPASDRMWSADGDEPVTTVCHWSGSRLGHSFIARCVAPERETAKPIVFLDVLHGFSSRDQQVLTDEQNHRLVSALAERGYKCLVPGSNGLMQALVASGGQAVASLTTAVGFPGDVCGALLVEGAGGSCRAFERGKTGDLQPVDSRNPLGVDLLVCANTSQRAEDLAAMVQAVAAAR